MSKISVTVDLLFAIKCNLIFFCRTVYEYLITNVWLRNRCESTKRLDGQVVVITGANTGIGKETALQLSIRGAKVIIGCRDIQKGENAAQDIRITNTKADIIVMKLDLSSLSSVRLFAKSVAKQVTKVDILINNAGVMMCPESTTDEGFELQLVSNYLGHFLLNHCLMPLLKKSTKARIVNLSSICHILGKIHFDNINLKNGVYRPMKAYSQSKLAIILSTQEMSRRLGTDSSVTVYSLHPGVIQTEITRHFPLYLYLFLKPFMISIETGTQTTLYCALEESIQNESGFYYENCQRLDNMVSQAIDAKSAQKLWDLSSDLVQLEDQLKIK